MRVKRDITKSLDLMDKLRETRHQIQKAEVDKQRLPKRGYEHTRAKSKTAKTSDYYHSYQLKIDKVKNEEIDIDSLGTRDLVYYFKDEANQAGNKYVISNIQRDMGVMKRARQRYSNRDIMLMIDFIFESDQDFVDKNLVQPTILVSNWTNTLLPSAELWLDDKFVPNGKKKHSKREWTGDTTTDKASIGEWGF